MTNRMTEIRLKKTMNGKKMTNGQTHLFFYSWHLYFDQMVT